MLVSRNRSLRVCLSLGALWLFAWLGIGGSNLALAAPFTASLDRENISVGESALLRLTFEGVTPTAIPAAEARFCTTVQRALSPNSALSRPES